MRDVGASHLLMGRRMAAERGLAWQGRGGGRGAPARVHRPRVRRAAARCSRPPRHAGRPRPQPRPAPVPARAGGCPAPPARRAGARTACAAIKSRTALRRPRRRPRRRSARTASTTAHRSSASRPPDSNATTARPSSVAVSAQCRREPINAIELGRLGSVRKRDADQRARQSERSGVRLRSAVPAERDHQRELLLRRGEREAVLATTPRPRSRADRRRPPAASRRRWRPARARRRCAKGGRSPWRDRSG